MALYITRNGQKYGPYSLAETQEHLRAGAIAPTDLAWQEGLATWVPLHQIPGIVYVPPPAPVAPVATTTPEALHRPRVENKSLFQKIGTGIVALAYAAFKFKFFLFSALKTSLSMLFMIWAYSLFFGWKFAAGFVFLILVHEMGHVTAAWLLGMPVSLPMFIPFIGAYTALRQQPQDAYTEAKISAAGPLAGGIGSVICLLAGFHFHAPWLIAVASASFVLNILNMIPIPPFDGGGISSAISPWFWFIGLLLLGLALVYFHSLYTSIFIIVIIIFYSLPRLRQNFFEPASEEMEQYYSTHISNRIFMAVAYLAILGGLLLGYGHASGYLTSMIDNP